jgi:hypothetical protein
MAFFYKLCSGKNCYIMMLSNRLDVTYPNMFYGNDFFCKCSYIPNNLSTVNYFKSILLTFQIINIKLSA